MIHGMSKIAAGPGPERNALIMSRSRTGCPLSPGGRFCLARRITAPCTGPARRSSSSRPIPDDEPVADRIEEALEGKGRHQHQRQADQRGNAATRNHTVVDLQHVDRSGEHQQIGGATDQTNRPERPTAFGQSGCQHIRLHNCPPPFGRSPTQRCASRCAASLHREPKRKLTLGFVSMCPSLR